MSELVEEVKVFIEYSVQQTEKKTALQTLAAYEENHMALKVMKDFYARLPKFREEAIASVSRIVSRHDAYLLDVETQNFQYLYFFRDEQPHYLGEKKDGIGDDDVLQFFGYADNRDFLKTVDKRSNEYADLKGKPHHFCPACMVGEGEIHLLGCPVEICPWCDGQFNMCNCRFEQLGIDEITEESELDRLEVILNEKGRVPFSADHAPSYPIGGMETDDD
jgi:hypothetical protein